MFFSLPFVSKLTSFGETIYNTNGCVYMYVNVILMVYICTCNTNGCAYVHVILMVYICTCNTNGCAYVHVILTDVHMYM